MASPSSVQPDFDLIEESHNQAARAHRDIAGEIRKLQNLPALDNGTEILESLRRIESKLDLLTTRQMASKRNAVARLENSNITSPDTPLAEFYSLRDNNTIRYFPSSSAQLHEMSRTELISVLGELGLPVEGSRETKVERVRAYIGLTKKAV